MAFFLALLWALLGCLTADAGNGCQAAHSQIVCPLDVNGGGPVGVSTVTPADVGGGGPVGH